MITYSAIGNYGRFGNQLFQYAMLFGVAKRNGFDFGIPQNLNCVLGNVFDGLHFLQEEVSIAKTIVEPPGVATVFLPHVFGVSDNVNYVGYFQSPKYFSHCKDDLKQHLSIKPSILKTVRDFTDRYRDIGFIHVRRGDYVTTKNGTCHPPVTVEYIQRAIEKSNASKFVIVSDDMNWCEENLGFVDYVVSPFTGEEFMYDFVLMTQCNSAIISNSSFSWWGAWLGSEKDVIAPSVWFGSDSSVPQAWNDVYCENWIVI